MDVFISYARRVHSDPANNLAAALGSAGIRTFIDSVGISYGDSFTKTILEALLNSRVVVVFESEQYFQSWFCLREWEIANTLPDGRGVAQVADCIVIAGDGNFSNLPPALRTTQWPKASDAAAIVKGVQAALAQQRGSIRDRIGVARAQQITTTFLESAAIPPPCDISSLAYRYQARGELDKSLNEGFLGRGRDLYHIHDLLVTKRGDRQHSPPSCVRISGSAGCGKSRLVAEYLHRFAADFFAGGVFWIDADCDEYALKQQWYALYKTVVRDKQIPPLPEIQDELSTLVADALRQFRASKTDGRDLLVVLDNVPEDSRPSKNNIARFLPGWDSVSVLVTSRQTISQKGVSPLELTTLTPEASVAVLRRQLPHAAVLAEDQWKDIAEWVGCLPLALDHLNQALVNGTLTASEALAKSKEKHPALSLDEISSKLSGLVGDAVRGVIETFLVSFRRLDEQTQVVLCVLSQFDPSPIPRALAELVEGARDSVRLALCPRHFLEGFNEQSAGSMHRVMNDFIRYYCELWITEQQEIPEGPKPIILASASFLLSKYVSDHNYTDPKDWPTFDSVAAHVHAVYEHAKNQPGVDPQIVKRACYAADRVANARLAQGFPRLALPSLQDVFETRQRFFGADDKDTLVSSNNLAQCLKVLGELDQSESLLRDTYEKRKATTGPNERDALISQTNLGSLLYNRKRYPEAVDVLKAAVDGWQRLKDGESDRYAIIAIGQLGVSYLAQGELPQARIHLERAVKLGRMFLKPQDPEFMKCRSNLAVLASEMGDLTTALGLNEEVLDESIAILGPKHPNSLSAMHDRAALYGRLGEASKERTLLLELVPLTEQELGANDSLTLKSKLNLGAHYLRAQDCEHALEVLRPVHAAYSRVEGEHALSTLTSAAYVTMCAPEPYYSNTIPAIYDLCIKHHGPNNDLARTLRAEVDAIRARK